MQRERRGESEARLQGLAVAEQDLGKMQHGGEMARFELERAADVVQAFGVASKQVVERRALVPRLGVLGSVAQQDREPGLGYVVALGGDVSRRGIERAGGGTVRAVHPGAPDRVFRLASLDARTGGEALKELRHRPPGARGG